MKTKVMEVITYKKQTSKTKYIIEAAFEYKPQFFFQKKKKKPRLPFKKIRYPKKKYHKTSYFRVLIKEFTT